MPRLSQDLVAKSKRNPHSIDGPASTSCRGLTDIHMVHTNMSNLTQVVWAFWFSVGVSLAESCKRYERGMKRYLERGP
jgi:hypothetical protein